MPSSNRVAIKVSLAAKYEVVGPETAINKVQDYQSALYMELQLGLREIVGSAKIEEVLEKRGEIGARLTESAGTPLPLRGREGDQPEIGGASEPGTAEKQAGPRRSARPRAAKTST